MERKPVRQWMLLMAWLVFLVIIVVHSGYLCRQLWFIIRQFFPVIGAGMLAFVLNRPYEYVRNFYEKKGRRPGLPAWLQYTFWSSAPWRRSSVLLCRG